MTSDKKTRGKIVPVVNLRHAKVVDGIHVKNLACIRPSIAPAGGSFPLEDYMEKYRRCNACFVVAVVQVSVAVFVVCRGQLEKRSCWYVTDK